MKTNIAKPQLLINTGLSPVGKGKHNYGELFQQSAHQTNQASAIMKIISEQF